MPTCLATWTGVRAGRMYTVVRKRSRSVTAARCPIVTHGSGHGVPISHRRVAVLRVRVGRPRLDRVDEVVGHGERAPAVLVARSGQRHELRRAAEKVPEKQNSSVALTSACRRRCGGRRR